MSDPVACYVISGEHGARKKVLDNALPDAAGVFFYTPGICLNTPFESLLSGRTVFAFEIAQEYPPRVPVSRLAQRLRYIRRYLSVRVPGGVPALSIGGKIYDEKYFCIYCPGFLGCALCGFGPKFYQP